MSFVSLKNIPTTVTTGERERNISFTKDIFLTISIMADYGIVKYVKQLSLSTYRITLFNTSEEAVNSMYCL